MHDRINDFILIIIMYYMLSTTKIVAIYNFSCSKIIITKD